MTRPTVSVLRTALEKCYQRAPRECEGGGSVRCCADCHNLLVETTTGSTCVDDRCPRSGPVKSRPIAAGVRGGWMGGVNESMISEEDAVVGAIELALTRLVDDFEVPDAAVRAQVEAARNTLRSTWNRGRSSL